MKRFDYDDDWELAEQPVIDPSTASQYIEGKYRKRFAQQEQRRRKLALDIDTPEERARVEQLAEDGHAQAMYVLAKAALDTDAATGFRLTYRAAIQGHKPAMRQLGLLYRDGRGVDADAKQAEFWSAEADADQTDDGPPRKSTVRRALGAARRTLRRR